MTLTDEYVRIDVRCAVAVPNDSIRFPEGLLLGFGHGLEARVGLGVLHDDTFCVGGGGRQPKFCPPLQRLCRVGVFLSRESEGSKSHRANAVRGSETSA